MNVVVIVKTTENNEKMVDTMDMNKLKTRNYVAWILLGIQFVHFYYGLFLQLVFINTMIVIIFNIWDLYLVDEKYRGSIIKHNKGE